MIRTVSLLSGLVLLLSYPAVGQEAAASRETSSQLSGSQLGTLKQKTSQSDLAQEWGLNQQEWTRYQTLMQGPRGVYSPGIDPLTALGIEARSAEERRRYADLQVQAERRRVEKELAYQRAYDEAFARAYPGEGVIRLTESSAANPLGTPNMSPALQSSGRWPCLSRTTAPPASSGSATCNMQKRSSTSTSSVARTTQSECGTGQSSPASTRRRFAASRSRSIMTRAAGWPWDWAGPFPPWYRR